MIIKELIKAGINFEQLFIAYPFVLSDGTNYSNGKLADLKMLFEQTNRIIRSDIIDLKVDLFELIAGLYYKKWLLNYDALLKINLFDVERSVKTVIENDYTDNRTLATTTNETDTNRVSAYNSDIFKDNEQDIKIGDIKTKDDTIHTMTKNIGENNKKSVLSNIDEFINYDNNFENVIISDFLELVALSIY